ncbi:MAG: hypothetical protein FJ276_28605 [Planctomycetes bacterium]|nr:hypothetical protein [Planctomycetota bacterium]
MLGTDKSSVFRPVHIRLVLALPQGLEGRAIVVKQSLLRQGWFLRVRGRQIDAAPGTAGGQFHTDEGGDVEVLLSDKVAAVPRGGSAARTSVIGASNRAVRSAGVRFVGLLFVSLSVIPFL